MKSEKQVEEEYNKVVSVETNTFRTGYIQALSWVLELSKKRRKINIWRHRNGFYQR